MSQSQRALLWWAPTRDVSGITEDARNLILSADSAGIAQRIQRIAWNNLEIPIETSIAKRLSDLEQATISGEVIRVSHFFPDYFERTADAQFHVGRATFETDRIPAPWVAKCNAMDFIWVPSQFNLESFARAGVSKDKLRALPEALDADFYRRDFEPFPFREGLGFVFLSVFAMQYRKGWDVLLEAFCREFKENEDVALVLKLFVMKQTAAEVEQKIFSYIREKIGIDPDRGPKVFVTWDEFPSVDMPRLYRTADCFVLATRGEGWGRPLMEALACGVPSIATRWSGHLDFMTDENSSLIDCKIVPVANEAFQDGQGFEDQSWAEPSVDHLRLLMRRAFADRAKEKAKAQKAKREILEKYNRRAIGQRIRELISF